MIERNSGPARLGVIGEANHDYVLEVSAGDISSNGWQPLITATLTNSPLMWFDSASALMPRSETDRPRLSRGCAGFSSD